MNIRPPDTIQQRLRSAAETLLSIADEIDQREQSEMPRPSFVQRMAPVLADIAMQIARGVPENEAKAAAAARGGVPLQSASVMWERSSRRRAAQELFARRYMARQMIAYGIDRQTIADLLGCHPNHVARMAAALDRPKAYQGITPNRTAHG